MRSVLASATIVLLLVSHVNADAPPPRQLDSFGDPLPPGAVKRFGKVRIGSYPDVLFPSADGKSICCFRYGVYLLEFDRATGRLTKTDSLPTEPSWQMYLSQDGRRVALPRHRPGTSSPQVIEVWDLATRKRVAKLGPFEESMWYSPSISPDGRFVVTVAEVWKPSGRRDLRVQVWDVDVEKQISSTEFSTLDFSRTGGWMNYGMFSTDGQSLLFSCGSGTQSLVQCLDAKTLKTRWERHLTGVGGIAGIAGEAPDGKLLMSEGDAVAAINLADGENCTVRVPHDFKPNSLIGFVNKGKTLLYIAGKDQRRELKAWDYDAGRPSEDLPAIPLSPNAWATSWVSRDQSDVLIISDGTWRLYDLKTAKPIWPEWPDAGHSAAVTALVFSQNGRRLASAGADNIVRLWDTQTGRQTGSWLIHQPFPHMEPEPGGSSFGRMGPPAIDLSADGRRLAFAVPGAKGEKEELRVIDTESGGVIATKALPDVKPAAGNDLGFGRLGFSESDDAILVVYGEADSSRLSDPIDKLARWNFVDGGWREVSSFVQSPPARSAWSRAGERMFVRGKAFDARTGKEVFELTGALDGPIACSADGRIVAAVGGIPNRETLFGAPLAEDIRIWDARAGELLVRLPWNPWARLRDTWPSASPANSQFVFFRGDPLAQTWPRQLAIHPTGRWLATADPKGVQLWDALQKRVVHTFALPIRPPIDQHHGSPATALAFSPDGTQLATGLPDGTILFWPMPKSDVQPLDSADLERLWTKLIGSDAAEGWRAVWKLAEHPRLAVELARSKLKVATAIPSDNLSRWIADLDSSNYRRREAATKELEAVADRLTPMAASAAKSSGLSPETQERLNILLRKAPDRSRPLSSGSNSLSRAVAMLEYANTKDAHIFLLELARGDPNAWLTREAKQALLRIRDQDIETGSRE